MLFHHKHRLTLAVGFSYIPANTSVLVSSTDISDSFYNGDSDSERNLAFNTSNGYIFLISFQQYCFEGSDEIIQIGDGMKYEEETRLLRFSGTTTPNDVTTVTNSVWIKIQYSPSELRLFQMKIASVATKGMIHLGFMQNIRHINCFICTVVSVINRV